MRWDSTNVFPWMGFLWKSSLGAAIFSCTSRRPHPAVSSVDGHLTLICIFRITFTYEICSGPSASIVAVTESDHKDKWGALFAKVWYMVVFGNQ